MHYDIRRGPHSVGSHVRDAAAYVCWAFGRAYAHTDMKSILEQLAPHLLTVACYDREVHSLYHVSHAYFSPKCLIISQHFTQYFVIRLIVDEQQQLLFRRMLVDRGVILMVLT